jgi:diaminohydroxyphosphoribosylaminopyrimidine deaminase/5-amino-6-(5-phosphoribosylamino)uracil reductase
VFWAQDEIAADIAPRPKRRRLPKIGSNATPWTFQIRSKRRPWVIAKCGMTLDGKIATADGESRWITGEPARREAHRLRSRVDAVLVGINTVLHDDPSLTVRLPRWKGKQPWRVVLDRQARMPVRAKMLRDGHPERVWIFVGTRAAAARVDRLVAAGAKVTRVKVRAGSLDLGEVLRELGRHEVGSLLVEGGGSVLGSFVREKRVNEAVFFIAPMVLGGARSVKAVGGKGFERWRDSLGVTVREVRRCGDDLMICGVVGEEV